jgi:hypothetical protein
MAKCRKKPVEVDYWPARELMNAAGHCWKDMPKEVRDAYELGGWLFCSDHIEIPTLGGTMRANSGDMVIRGVKGEFYPCKPDVFAAKYEPVKEDH